MVVLATYVTQSHLRSFLVGLIYWGGAVAVLSCAVENPNDYPNPDQTCQGALGPSRQYFGQLHFGDGFFHKVASTVIHPAAPRLVLVVVDLSQPQ